MSMVSEKHALEIGAVTEFSEALVSEIGAGRFVFDRLLNPPMPDALCSFDGQPLYVEIAHLYGTKSATNSNDDRRVRSLW